MEQLNKLIEKYQGQFDRLKESIKQYGQAENRGMIDLLYPKMQQVSEFLEDLRQLQSNIK